MWLEATMNKNFWVDGLYKFSNSGSSLDPKENKYEYIHNMTVAKLQT